jgi:protein involved in polysaccharide export with SLBB domain
VTCVLWPVDAAEAAKTTSDYILQPGDLLHIEVLRVDELKRDRRITQEYSIDMPLIGVLNLRGMTLREATQLIRARYEKDYLVNPQVSVNVIEYVKRYVNVIGQVNNAGAVEFPPEQGLTLNQAITRAGGPTRLANLKKVTLSRLTEEGTSEKTIVNVEDIIAGKARDIPLQKDDTIQIPENLI